MAYLPPFKLPRPLFTRPEAWYHLLWLPVVYPVAGWLLIGERYFSQLNVFVVGTLTMLVIHAVDLLVLTIVVKGIIAHYAGLQQVQQRNGLALGVGTLLAAILAGSSVWICSQVPLLGTSFSAGVVLSVAGVGAISALLMGYVLIVTDTYKRWQEDQAEKQQLRQMAMQQQIDALKGQINPHFLFNSLNSVSSLIASEPQQAEEFVDQMAKVYRYMLQAHTRRWVSLDQEIQFARSYAQLLMVRYRQALLIELEEAGVEEQQLGIPPLTLRAIFDEILYCQTVHVNKPLRIRVWVAHQQLRIQHTHQPRQLRVETRAAGFNEVVSWYKLLGAPPPRRKIMASCQQLWLPLIPLSPTPGLT